MNALIDVSLILSSVRVPTLVLHRSGDVLIPVEHGRELAALIPDAKYIEYPGQDHAFWIGDMDSPVGDIEEFITGHRESAAKRS